MNFVLEVFFLGITFLLLLLTKCFGKDLKGCATFYVLKFRLTPILNEEEMAEKVVEQEEQELLVSLPSWPLLVSEIATEGGAN